MIGDRVVKQNYWIRMIKIFHRRHGAIKDAPGKISRIFNSADMLQDGTALNIQEMAPQ